MKDKKELWSEHMFGDMRDLTPEEEEAYEKSLLKMSEDTGEDFWEKDTQQVLAFCQSEAIKGLCIPAEYLKIIRDNDYEEFKRESMCNPSTWSNKPVELDMDVIRVKNCPFDREVINKEMEGKKE